MEKPSSKPDVEAARARFFFVLVRPAMMLGPKAKLVLPFPGTGMMGGGGGGGGGGGHCSGSGHPPGNPQLPDQRA